MREVWVDVLTGIETRSLTEPEGTTVGQIRRKLGVPKEFNAILSGDGFSGETVQDGQVLGCNVDDLELEFVQTRNRKG